LEDLGYKGTLNIGRQIFIKITLKNAIPNSKTTQNLFLPEIPANGV
jgi:hypothetical protein